MHSTKSKTKPQAKASSEPNIHLEFEAIGTHWAIDIYEQVASTVSAKLAKDIADRIEVYDRNYSRFRADSLVTQMKQPGTYTLPADAQPLFDTYQKLYELTDGAMTPLIGGTLSDAGYDANYSLQAGQLHHPPAWHEALQYTFPELVVKRPVILDLGAAGKGYLVDIVGEILTRHGIQSFCIDAGGDILGRSPTGDTLAIGLEHPAQKDTVIGIAQIGNQSICGSAGNRRAWGDFHHILHPQTLKSPRHIEALWVVADTALLADALSTALFFVEPEILQANYTFEYAIMHADYSLTHSTQFPATFFIEPEETTL